MQDSFFTVECSGQRSRRPAPEDAIILELNSSMDGNCTRTAGDPLWKRLPACTRLQGLSEQELKELLPQTEHHTAIRGSFARRRTGDVARI
jgi:hypothetical protein